MSTDNGEPVSPHRPDLVPGESVEEQIRRRGIKPIESVEDMACYDIFETDEELDEFLAYVYAERRANLA
jgi:hypothetical protein